MHSKRVLRTTILSIILVLSSLLPSLIITHSISAESIVGETTFYFKDVSTTDLENDLDFGAPVSIVMPTKKADSTYPPKLLKLNTSKTTEEMQYWLLTWSLYLFSQFDENLTDELGDFGDIFQGFEILLPHPYRIVGSYTNDGNDTLEITGDVVFDLHFSTFRTQNIGKILKDKVKVGLYTLGDFLPSEVKNKTTTIKSSGILINSISQQIITLENVNFYLQPGKSLLFTVELLQKDKLIFNFLKSRYDEERIINILTRLGNFLENRSRNEKFQDLGTIIKEAIPIIEEFNFSINDIDTFINTFRSSSFVYDSVNHPSSVTLNIRLPEEPENSVLYYLHDGSVMDEIQPFENSTQKKDQIKKEQLMWQGPSLERNKIIKEATAKLYINHKDLLFRLLNIIRGKVKITASLFDNDKNIGTAEQSLGRTLFNLFGKPDIPVKFKFNISNVEIENGHNISLKISSNIGSRFNGFGTTRGATLFYDSTNYPSTLSLQFKDTDHIKINTVENPSNGKIVPGGSAHYEIDIISKFDDEITVEVKDNKKENWDVTITNDNFNIDASGTAKTSIYVNSTDNTKNAYGESIDLTFIVAGKTGIARQKTSVEISEDAVKYDINIIEYTESKNLKKGSSGSFYFIIQNNNTGAEDDVDSYEIDATSENNWNIKKTDSIDDLRIGEKTGSSEILVVVAVPKNTSKKSDTINFTVISVNNPNTKASVEVTVDVIEATLFESIYEFFESSSDSMGLDEIFGSYGPHALAAIIGIIVIFLIIILIFFLTRKVINIICEERIKEIDPNDHATFKITIENPSKKEKTYEVSTVNNPISDKWEKAIDSDKITIGGKKAKSVFLIIKPTEKSNPNDWTETKVNVKLSGRRKSEEITTMTMLKDGKTLLKISDVFTWPKSIIPGDRITTSFKIYNKGNITARKVLVKLFINGKEKNKTEVNIPSGGYADIKMPWIGLKGKNGLYLKLIEQ
jgi:hypothetical protein